MGAVIVLPDSTSKSATLMVVAGTSGIERITITLRQISLIHPDIALKNKKEERLRLVLQARLIPRYVRCIHQVHNAIAFRVSGYAYNISNQYHFSRRT